MEYLFEKKKLKSYLGEDLYNQLKYNNAIISGGMITSLFTRSEINDVDVYFRNNKDLYNFAEINIGHVVSHTKKATQWLHDGLSIQVIKFKYFEKAEDIFESFDFTVCMGAFDFKTEEFILHEDFLKHNAQRLIRFNSKTAYPLISAIRLQKYESKGYFVSKSEFMRVVMTCMSLDINSYDELKEQLGGMYGESYDRLFEDIEDDDFSLVEAIDKLKDLALDDSYFKEYKPIEYDINEILQSLDESEHLLYKFKKGVYQTIGKKFKVVYKYEDDEVLNPKDTLIGVKLYKFVKKTGDKLFSIYDNNFEYKLGEIVKAEKEWTFNSYGSHGMLFFNYQDTLNQSSYYNKRFNENIVLLEVEINGEDIIKASNTDLQATACKVIKVIEQEEYKNWI